MELRHGIFAVKLCELEQEYGRLLSRLQLLQGKDAARIRWEREQMQEEYREHGLLLEETARSCRSHTMAHLTELQQNYERQMTEILESDHRTGQAETLTLASEYAIDFATQAMRYALLTALRAQELQMEPDKPMTKGEHDKYE